MPIAITYNFKAADYYQYNISGANWSNEQMARSESVNRMCSMKNSSATSPNKNLLNVFESSSKTCSYKTTEMGISHPEQKCHGIIPSSLLANSKLELLKKVLAGISDENQVIIAAKPKNRSQKIRKSNRHSRFRGVSLNGKKWQVMIMGPFSKKYFGGFSSERTAAVFYDKLCILTNGLGSKTNFNYRKRDL
jgi:hypothetical protein